MRHTSSKLLDKDTMDMKMPDASASDSAEVVVGHAPRPSRIKRTMSAPVVSDGAVLGSKKRKSDFESDSTDESINLSSAKQKLRLLSQTMLPLSAKPNTLPRNTLPLSERRTSSLPEQPVSEVSKQSSSRSLYVILEDRVKSEIPGNSEIPGKSEFPVYLIPLDLSEISGDPGNFVG